MTLFWLKRWYFRSNLGQIEVFSFIFGVFLTSPFSQKKVKKRCLNFFFLFIFLFVHEYGSRATIRYLVTPTGSRYSYLYFSPFGEREI